MPPEPTKPTAGPATTRSTEGQGPSSLAQPARASSDEDLVHRLRAGDDDAFAEIVDGWSGAMLRVARAHVSTDASAEEIVQDAWMAVVKGWTGSRAAHLFAPGSFAS